MISKKNHNFENMILKIIIKTWFHKHDFENMISQTLKFNKMVLRT